MCAETHTSLFTSLVASSAVKHGFCGPAKASAGESAVKSTSHPTRCRAMVNLRGKLTLRLLPVVALHILIEYLLELSDNRLAAQGGVELAVHIDRRLGLLKGARQADAQVGVLGFSRTVDHAAHRSEERRVGKECRS